MAVESVLRRIAIKSADSHTNIGEQKLHTFLKHEMKAFVIERPCRARRPPHLGPRGLVVVAL